MDFENKVLGLIWDKNNDTINFNFIKLVEHFSLTPTKRGVLKSIASMFDPLRLFNPIIFRMKVLFQDLCVNKVAWDEYLSGEMMDRWQDIIDDSK